MVLNLQHMRGGDTQQNSDFFETRVRPLLAEKCYPCHTASEMGNLRLDSKERLLKGGKSGPAVVPGDPEKSLLVQAITGRHERLKMPPTEPLKEAEISVLTEWVREGAFWPEPLPQHASRLSSTAGRVCDHACSTCLLVFSTGPSRFPFPR